MLSSRHARTSHCSWGNMRVCIWVGVLLVLSAAAAGLWVVMCMGVL